MRSKYNHQKSRGHSVSSSNRKSSPAVCLEPLEARRLLSVSITRSIDHTFMVSGTFSSWDPTHTVETDVIVTGTEMYNVANGKAVPGFSDADVSLSVENASQGYFVTVGEASTLAPTIVSIDPSLGTAHVVADVTITDQNTATYTVHADFKWRAFGAVLAQCARTFSVDAPGIAEIDTTYGASTNAIVTGTLSVPATQFFSAIPNATPASTTNGQIEKVITGTTTITISLPPKLSQLLETFSGTTIPLDGADLLQKLTGM